jgi:hypothetical protein
VTEAEGLFCLRSAANTCADVVDRIKQEHGQDAARAAIAPLLAARETVIGRRTGSGAPETAAAFATALAAAADGLAAGKRREVAQMAVEALLSAGVTARALTARAIKQMEDAREEIKLDKLRFDESLDEYTRKALMALRDFQTVDEQIANAEDDFQVRSTASLATGAAAVAAAAAEDTDVDKDSVGYDLRGEEGADAGEEWEDVTR